MRNDMIQICGLTDLKDYPHCPPKHPCKEVSYTDTLCIPCLKPDIKGINEVFVNISITSFKIICTAQGSKLIMDGLKHIKILYTAENSCESVHSAHFDVPFCEFILLEEAYSKIFFIETAIEHIAAYQICSREFAVSTVILLCPVFKTCHPCPQAHKYCCHCRHCCKKNRACDRGVDYDDCNDCDDR